MLDTWWFNLIAYLIVVVIFGQSYKIATKSCKKDGALTILLQFLSGALTLVLAPFYAFQFPSEPTVYIFLALACIFYAASDRINTTARRGLESSVFSILEQLSTVFVITWGILFFKEAVVLKKILGALLIIAGNVFVIYRKGKFKLNKYIILSILGNLALSIGMSIDVGISDHFNVPIYVAITLIVPSLILLIAERVNPKDIIKEFKHGNKWAIMMVGLTWGTAMLLRLRAYQFGDITTIAPLCAIKTILNVFAAYFFLKERDSLPKKIIAAIIVILGIIIIKI